MLAHGSQRNMKQRPGIGKVHAGGRPELGHHYSSAQSARLGLARGMSVAGGEGP